MSNVHQKPPSLLLDELRSTVEGRLQPFRRVDLPTACDEIRLPDAPDDKDLTKRQYLISRLERLTDQDDVRAVATEFVNRYPLGSSGNDKTYDLELGRLFVVNSSPMPFLYEDRNSLHWQIRQHVVRNTEDWSVVELFQQLGAFQCSSERFRRLIERLAGPEARPDVASQRSFVKDANSVLIAHGFRLVETGELDGYPAFSFVRPGDRSYGRPKNIIFASSSKPDLRFRDAVDNDIEIVTHADDVFVYDDPITDGLLWRDLQSWWARRENIVDAECAKRTLYLRLLDSLPASSPPQRFLFRAFYKHHKERVPSLPALIPEVWLHYDPRTIRERGRDALLRQRMDFLMLLPAGVRIVLEVDGQQHYSLRERPAPQRYAKLVSADRELKLCGYEVYRFGAAELDGEIGERLVGSFFDDLFGKHSVTQRLGSRQR